MLNRDQEAGCVEHPRHIRLSQNGAGNFGRTTCFFHINSSPQARARLRGGASQFFVLASVRQHEVLRRDDADDLARVDNRKSAYFVPLHQGGCMLRSV